MPVDRMIDHLIAAQDVALLNSISKRHILNRCPLYRDIHLIFATFRQPSEKVYQSELQQYYPNHKNSFPYNNRVCEYSIQVVLKEFKVQLE
jgi:hypothetical protein